MVEDKEYIFLVTRGFGLVIGLLKEVDKYSRYVIDEPLKIDVKSDGSVNFSGIFTNEKWVKMPVTDATELPLSIGLQKGYEEAKMQIFTGLVTASPKEKKLILQG